MNIPYSINLNGRLMTFEEPKVMGILNVTDNSFFEGSRLSSPAEVLARAQGMIADGASILDVGACSTRPGSTPVPVERELERLHAVLELLDRELPGAVVSVDTFRAQVARECVREHNVAIINDVSGFEWDDDMLSAVAALKVPYVLTHSVGFAGDRVQYENFLPQVLQRLAAKLWQLRQAGVPDVIIDPGFGFAKSLEENYEMLAALQEFEVLEAPLLVGLSRKSMITRLLGVDAVGALAGTVALNMAALERGASILRVHDVKEAAQTVRLFVALRGKDGEGKACSVCNYR